MSSYMNCPRCGLSVRLRTDRLAWDCCPRCLGRAGIEVPVFVLNRRVSAPNGVKLSAVASEVADDPGPAPDHPRPSQLLIAREYEADTVILTLWGELDVASSPRLEGELEDAESSGRSRIVLDLSGLKFMDSTGLTVLLRAQLRARENGHHLSLLRGPRTVHHVFEVTNAASLFAFED